MDSILILGGTVLVLLVAYLGYGAWLADRWGINTKRKTPAASQKDDWDYALSSAPVVVGHQFSSIASIKTIQGTILASVFGWIPVLLWLVVGGILLGAVQNFAALLASVRHGGRSIGSVVEKYMGRLCGKLFCALAWISMVFLLALLLELASGQLAGFMAGDDGGTVQNICNGSVAMTVFLLIPAGILFGYLNRMRCPLVLSTLFGLVLVAAAVAAGILFPIYLEKQVILYLLLVYVVLSVILPVWFLIQPRDYLSSFLIYVLMLVAGAGICVAHPQMTIPSFAGWKADGNDLLPYLFLLLPTGALSGYHALINGGISSRQLNNERNAKAVGFGPILLGCLLGVLVLVSVGSIQTAGGWAVFDTPLDALVSSVLGFCYALGVGEQWKLPIQIVVWLVLAVMVFSVMDTCARAASIAFQELFESKDGKKNILQNRATAAILTVAAAWGIDYIDCDWALPALGVYLILLSIPVCLGCMAWLKQIGQKHKSLFLPLAAAVAVLGVSLAWILWENVGILLEKGVTKQTMPKLGVSLLAIFAGVSAIIFIVNGVKSYMKKRKIIFATGNEGKMKEIREILGDLDAEILSLKDAGIEADVDENGETFEENAIIKAKAISELSGCLVLADDSGLEIDYLNKEPGVYSARYMGEDTSYTIKNNNLIERLEGVPEEERTARFVCVIAAAFPDGSVLTARGTMEGFIGYEERGENGFGYDPIFFLKEFGCTSAELSMEDKNKISHRGKALRAMKEKLV